MPSDLLLRAVSHRGVETIDWSALKVAATSISEQRLLDGLIDDELGLEPVPGGTWVESARALLLSDVERLRIHILGSVGTIFEVDGAFVHVVGGVSAGDDPSREYAAIRRLTTVSALDGTGLSAC